MNGVEEAPPPVPEARRGLLGEILIREGLINEGQLSTALMVQRETEPTTPLGQILVRQGAITQRQLNNVLDRYRKKYRLGDILVETETITEHQLQIALDHQKKTGLRLGDSLLQLNFVTEEEVNQALCKQFGVTFVDLDRLVLDNSLALVINREYAERHRVIPISKTDRVLVVAMDDPSDLGRRGGARGRHRLARQRRDLDARRVPARLRPHLRRERRGRPRPARRAAGARVRDRSAPSTRRTRRSSRSCGGRTRPSWRTARRRRGRWPSSARGTSGTTRP